MKQKTRTLPFLLLLFLLAGCAKSEPQPVVDTEADKAAIRDAYKAFTGFFEAGDAEAVASNHTADAMRMFAGEPDRPVRPVEMEFWPRLFSAFTVDVRDVVEGVEVDGNLGVFWGSVDNLFVLKADPTVTYPATGKMMGIWKRDTEGSWKLSRIIIALDAPIDPAVWAAIPESLE